ncbi:MAG: hypothetical protein LAT82_00060 [Nanoarchaeota archaeon]|nr:hypothetical protein [Nanoarchaeota archaeon]
MSSTSKHPPFYLFIIVAFSLIIGFIVVFQINNNFYVPEHSSCRAFEYEVRACVTDLEVRFDVRSARESSSLHVNFKDQERIFLEPLRLQTVRIPRGDLYEIVPEYQGNKCIKKAMTIYDEDLNRC